MPDEIKTSEEIANIVRQGYVVDYQSNDESDRERHEDYCQSKWISLDHLNDKIKALKDEIKNFEDKTAYNEWQLRKSTILGLIDKHLPEGK
jgi:chromosome segregation ATPase